MKTFLLVFLIGLNVFSQNKGRIDKIDSIQINFEVINSTISYDNCKNLDDEFSRINNGFKFVVTDPELIQLFRIDTSELKRVEGNMHFDTTVSIFEDGKKSTYCMKRFSHSTLSDVNGNIYDFPNSYYTGILNHLIYFNFKQGLVECLTDYCNKEIDNSSLFINMIRTYAID